MNTESIGKYISHLRREREWTQRQLAKQLNVTHQAVSKWEKGTTLPDVETLMIISKLFGITVDMILNAEIRTETSESHDESLNTATQEDTDSKQDSKDTYKTRIIDNIKIDTHIDDCDGNCEKIKVHIIHNSDDENIDPSVKKLIDLAPFISRKILDKKFMEIIKDKESLQLGVVARLAPFLSKDVLKAAIDLIAEGEVEPKLIQYVAPFINKNDLVDLIKKMQNDKWVSENLVTLAPFLPREFLDDMFLNEI